MKQGFQIIVWAFFLMSCKNYYKSYKTLESFSSSAVEGEVARLAHKKSGAELILIKNKDPARGFAAAFKTPPYDDTGLFHIFEHAVLAGSRLYPSKSNFFKVIGSSVAHFINALTYSVSTLYPFITRDGKDFDNLLSVYMDAVFFPKAIQDPRIMQREGWRYEVHPETKKMSINGIVLNEMKGFFASPYTILYLNLNRALLPQTPYAYESGGLPEQIASLRFEQIVSAHKKYYHPQNALIILYGDIDFKKALSLMDKQFLSLFDKDTDFKSPEIPRQKDFAEPKSPPAKAFYPGQKGKNKDFAAKGYVLGPLSRLEEESFHILLKAFASNPVAPLKLRALKEGLASSVFYQPLEGEDNALAFVFEGAESSKREKLGQILQEEIDKAIQEGLDQELVASVLNQHEFYLKEKSNSRWKSYFWSKMIMQNWLYPDLPLSEELDFISRLNKTRELLSSKAYIKNFFQKHLKENKRYRWLVMEPDPLFSEKFNKAMDKRVEQALSLKSINEYEKEDQVYRQWLSAKEPQEIIDKIPLLKLSDFKADDPAIPFKKSKMGSAQIIEYPQKANGVSYIDLFFDLRGVQEKNLKNLELFASLLKKTDTDNYSFQKLQKQMGAYVGRMSFEASAYQSAKNPKEFKPLMKVSLRFLNENREKSFELLKEVLAHSRFTPTDHAQNLLAEIKTDMSHGVSHRAVDLALMAAQKSFFPAQGGFESETSGGAFERYILKSKLDASQLLPELKALLKNIFNQNRLFLATITADHQELKALKAETEKLKSVLPSAGSADQKWLFAKQKNYQGYAIPGESQYVAESASFKEQGLDYSGQLLVYSQYLETHFMYPKLREQNGAYGAWPTAERNGLWSFQTYKDPHLKKTFDIFSQAVDFMKNEILDQKKIHPAILGSLKRFYEDLSVYGKMDLMTYLFLADLSWEDYIQTKKEILETSPESFQKINQALAKSLKKSQKAVAGNPAILKKEAPFLKDILPLN